MSEFKDKLSHQAIWVRKLDVLSVKKQSLRSTAGSSLQQRWNEANKENSEKVTYKHNLHQCPSWILPISAFLCSLSQRNMVQMLAVASSLDFTWIASRMHELECMQRA